MEIEEIYVIVKDQVKCTLGLRLFTAIISKATGLTILLPT